MVYSIGFVMIGGYFGFLVLLARFVEAFLPTAGPFVFFGTAVLVALALMRLQTRMERYFINRHVLKHPKSRWNVVVSSQQVRVVSED